MLLEVLLARRDELDGSKLKAKEIRVVSAIDSCLEGLGPLMIFTHPRFSKREMMGPIKPRCGNSIVVSMASLVLKPRASLSLRPNSKGSTDLDAIGLDGDEAEKSLAIASEDLRVQVAFVHHGGDARRVMPPHCPSPTLVG